MSLAESELALSETKVNELSGLLSQAQDDHTHMSKLHQTELKREREVSRATQAGGKQTYL